MEQCYVSLRSLNTELLLVKLCEEQLMVVSPLWIFTG